VIVVEGVRVENTDARLEVTVSYSTRGDGVQRVDRFGPGGPL